MAGSALTRVLSAHEKDVVRREMDRVLESPSFRQSKRCTSLLRHVVESALNENFDGLRERNLGVELFNRAPDYGTTEDAVVRVAAAETRKRLAQYYDQFGQVEGIRIELPTGGYVPEFRWEVIAAPQPAPNSRRWLLAVPAALAAAALAFWGSAFLASPAERFWRPVLREGTPVTVCLGLVDGISGPVPAAQFKQKALDACKDSEGCQKFFASVHVVARGSAPTGDVIGVAHMTGYLGKLGKAFRLRGHSELTYADMKESDTVLIGYFSNHWTVQAQKANRFSLRHGPPSRHVFDQLDPGNLSWTISGGWPLMNNEVDYAIVSRVTDPQTKRTQIAAAGFTPFGTEAAASLLGNEKSFNEILDKLPSGWHKKNLQLVLRTRVNSMMPGPPELVASHVW
jgi:hypothetical protein